MTVEEQLKQLILSRFKSVRAFAIAIGVPPSTINNIFSRGVGGVGIATAVPLCRALNIDVEYLASGEIRSKNAPQKNDIKPIGDRIAARRKELGLTLEDVGNYVGVTKSTVRKWETGYIANMRRDKIALLAKVLDMSPIEFVLPAGEMIDAKKGD